MKLVCVFGILTAFFFSSLSAQRTVPAFLLKNGIIPGGYNLMGKGAISTIRQSTYYKQKYYTLVRFDELPDRAEMQRLSALGIHLFNYVSGKGFMAEITDSSLLQNPPSAHIQSVFGLPQKLKISQELQQDPDVMNGNATLAISFFGSLGRDEVIRALQSLGAQQVVTKIRPAGTIFVRAPFQALQQIAALPFVAYVQKQELKDISLNYNNRAAHGLDALNAPSGRNLHGQNVTVGIGDDADPSSHVDFSGRLIQRNPSGFNFHGTHTSGTAGGAGIVNPKYRGMAPQSTLVTQYFSDILVNAPAYVNDFNMVLTNNSYFTGANNCPGDGAYDVLSNYADDQLDSFPTMLHVFASGNDGALTCSPYPQHYGTIKSGFQCGKDVLTVGNLDNATYLINSASSSGPVNDGRIKPEIVAGGTFITSTYPNNAYGTNSGTSMSCPTVTGTLALLYERYRQLHGGADPSAALIKAVACNSADDLGNPGPDFQFGFGTLNALTAVQTLENNQYFSGAVANHGTINFNIPSVPAGTQQVKIMLYWSDPPAVPFAASSLVNDLDLTVSSPDATIHHPLVLDPSPAGVSAAAQEGADHINNIEQVVINNPLPGNYSVQVSGTSVPQGPQTCFVVYELIQPSVNLVYPSGNETWVPGETENIRWTAYGTGGNSFSIDYSTDNGATWTNISNAVPGTSRQFPWIVPSLPTGKALVRVTANALGYSATSNFNFTILGQPQVTVTNPCRGYAQLVWHPIPSATLYEVMMLKGDSMQAVANTTDTSYMVGGLNPDSNYWLGVRAYINTTFGRRSLSSSLVPAAGSCALPAFNNDMTVDSLISPLTGRMFTSSQLGTAPIQVEIRNLGSVAAASPFNIFFQVNGGTIVSESANSLIPANSVYNYTFALADAYNFSSPGTYSIKVWISYPGDPFSGNDTLSASIKQLQNDPVTLNPVFTEGFETTAPAVYLTRTLGFTGLDRCDFSTSGANGRARTFINTGFAHSGDRCVTLDQAVHKLTSNADSLITTFNLGAYTSASQIWLDFYYKNQGIDSTLPGNKVWIRGNDQAAWIQADSLSTNPNDIGIYKASRHIDLTGLLASASPTQTFSSSFQVKFGQEGFSTTNSVIPDGNLDNGYTFDDISFTRSTNDVGMVALASPSVQHICNLSSAESVSVLVRNYDTVQLNNIPITVSINGATTTETIPSIGPDQTLTYTFNQKFDLSAFQGYQLTAWVSYPTDNYRKNDTLPEVDFHTTPIISAYPYLEGFETNDGYWYAGGINSDWQWGTPQKQIINRAANGTKAWVTNLTGNYSDNEQSYLYSPCFDLSSLTQPELSFSHIFRTEDNCDCDYHWVEYSTDDSAWTVLGKKGQGTNWYDDSAKNAWQLSDTNWHVSSYDIPTTGTKVRFRIAFSSDPATNYEGVAIDDVHIFDKADVYTGSNITQGLSHPASGNSWIDFDIGGTRVASLNPNGQDLGNCSVEVFIDSGAVRDTIGQYYLERNIVVRSGNSPAAPVGVRFYFTDAEATRLIHAAGCPTCTSIHDAYLSGITQYSSGVTQEEDSTLANNIHGKYHYIPPRQAVHIIPNANGYYAEYSVSHFSEFWINGGGPGQSLPLAGILDSFWVTEVGKTGLLQWITFQEMQTIQFVIEKSTDSVNFTPIGSVPASGTTDTLTGYRFSDTSLAKGNNFYRIKIVFASGQFIYSPVINLFYNPALVINGIFPNPVLAGSTLYINTNSKCTNLELYDALGRLIRSQPAHGMQNSMYMVNLAKGVYFIAIFTGEGRITKKILVN